MAKTYLSVVEVMPFSMSCKHVLSGHFDHHTAAEAIEFNGTILLRFTSAVLLLLLIIKNKHRAAREDGRRASLLVLPSYYPAICIMIFYYFVFAILHVFITGFNRYMVLVALDVAVGQGIGGGLAFFLMQHGAGVYAVQRAALFSVGFGVLAFLVFYFMLSKSGDHSGEDNHLTQRTYMAHMMFSSLIFMFYGVAVFLPTQYLYRRPAFYRYAKYCMIESVIWSLASSLVYMENNVGYCTVLSGRIILSAILHPTCFVFSLAKDSEFWQGCGIPISDQSPVHEVWDLNLHTASAIGTVLSDMQRHVKSLPMIHFSSIEFDVNSFIAGGLSRVYFGKCNQEKVAIKVLFAIELTPKVVTDFYTEVQVMYQLRHENIVQCLGISVMPPTICVILEYCPYGSLFDFLYQKMTEKNAPVSSNAKKRSTSPVLPQLHENNIELSDSHHTTSSTTSTKKTTQRPMSAPAVPSPYLQNPLHANTSLAKHVDSDAEPKDKYVNSSKTKSFMSIREKFLNTLPENIFTFAVSRQTMATSISTVSEMRRESQKKGKCAMRCFTKIEKYSLMLGACRGVAFLHSKGYMHCDIKSPNFLIAKDHVVKLGDLGEAREIGKEYETLPFPAYNWAPPELLDPEVSKRFYTEASDIYGLGMVFYEILTQQLPLEDIFATFSEAEIFHHLVIEKQRPHIPLDAPAALASLITRAWDTDFSQRPSAEEAITILEGIYADELSEL